MGVGAGSSDDGAACPAYPWPHDDGAARKKVFMQSDCAACHTSLPYAGIREAARGDAEPKLAEIVVVVNNEERTATARPPLSAAASTPDLTITTKMLDLLRRNNLYTAQELLRKKIALPAPVWLQFLQQHT